MATETKQVPDVKDVTSIEPPSIVRSRESSIPVAVLDAMAKGIDDSWRTNGEAYGSKKLASNAAGLYRRRLLAHLKLDGKALKSRVWDSTGEGNPDSGSWVFALTKRNST